MNGSLSKKEEKVRVSHLYMYTIINIVIQYKLINLRLKFVHMRVSSIHPLSLFPSNFQHSFGCPSYFLPEIMLCSYLRLSDLTEIEELLRLMLYLTCSKDSCWTMHCIDCTFRRIDMLISHQQQKHGNVQCRDLILSVDPSPRIGITVTESPPIPVLYHSLRQRAWSSLRVRAILVHSYLRLCTCSAIRHDPDPRSLNRLDFLLYWSIAPVAFLDESGTFWVGCNADRRIDCLPSIDSLRING